MSLIFGQQWMFTQYHYGFHKGSLPSPLFFIWRCACRSYFSRRRRSFGVISGRRYRYRQVLFPMLRT